MTLQPGDLFYIYSLTVLPKPKFKYAICVCDIDRLFFWINSKRRKLRLDAQLHVTPTEIPSLKHESWVDTSRFVTYDEPEIKDDDYRGTISNSVKNKIRQIVSLHNHLSPKQQQLVLTNLT